jgi:hypothetical protein
MSVRQIGDCARTACGNRFRDAPSREVVPTVTAKTSRGYIMAVTLPKDHIGQLGDAELLELVVEVVNSTSQHEALERYAWAHRTKPADRVITLPD